MTGLKFGSSLKWPARRVVLAWLAMTLIAVATSLAVGQRMQRGVFDGWQQLRPRDLSATDVRVVMIDDRSIEALGSWPWSRYYLARLTEQLAASGAKVIAFDILFPEHDRIGPETFVSLYPELSAPAAAEIQALQPMDQLFGQVIGSAPVVLAHAGVEEAPAGQPPLADASIAGGLPPGVDSWPAELAAIPELDDVALGHGLINVPPDSDGVIRRVPLAIRAGNKPRPGFAAEISRNMRGGNPIVMTASNARIGNRRVPIDQAGRMRMHFGTFPPDKIIPASLVIGKSKEIGAGIFDGKPVIIGLSAEGTSDIAATPLAAQEFGPLVQAQAVDAILRDGWLDRPIWAGHAEWAMSALLALAALGAAVFGRAYRIAVALVIAALPLVSWLAFARASILLDPARPLLIGVGSAAGVALGLFAVARVERERLREALVQERIETAETEGELQAARAIQLGMVPPRERLCKLDPRVDLDALLEPARSIGGDYYDAMKIGEDQIGFAIADVTGKGVPAALFMAMSKALTSAALSRMQADPATMAAAINSELLKDNSEAMGVAILLGILDLQNGEVRMVCAGHEDPLLLSREGQPVRLHLDGGPPLCVIDFPYPLETVRLQPGQGLALVTDGVTEAQNAQGALFGRERILAGLAGRSASAIVEEIRNKVRLFEDGTEATDDLTVMVLRYLGSN